MTGRLRGWWRNHWQAWTCLHGWSRAICIADDLAHMLHLPTRWLCDLHDGRLMRTMGEDCVNDLHDSAITAMWNEGEPVELNPRSCRGASMIGWRKPSACANNSCVQIAIDPTAVLLRDSKDPDGPRLSFSHQEWAALVEGVKAGEFDLP